MNGHNIASLGRSGLIERRIIQFNGEFVLVDELWDCSAADCPICAIPRGAPLPQQFRRAVPMFRDEAVKRGIISK